MAIAKLLCSNYCAKSTVLSHVVFPVVLAPPIGFIDPIELAGLYEGDIVLPNNLKCPNNALSCQSGKNGIIKEEDKWPGGVIPYFISAQFSKYCRRERKPGKNGRTRIFYFSVRLVGTEHHSTGLFGIPSSHLHHLPAANQGAGLYQH